jgi:hypothetical protein
MNNNSSLEQIKAYIHNNNIGYDVNWNRPVRVIREAFKDINMRFTLGRANSDEHKREYIFNSLYNKIQSNDIEANREIFRILYDALAIKKIQPNEDTFDKEKYKIGYKCIIDKGYFSSPWFGIIKRITDKTIVIERNTTIYSYDINTDTETYIRGIATGETLKFTVSNKYLINMEEDIMAKPDFYFTTKTMDKLVRPRYCD